MSAGKTSSEEKSNLHPRNKHKSRYDFQQLILSSPELSKYVALNPYNDLSIDFNNSLYKIPVKTPFNMKEVDK